MAMLTLAVEELIAGFIIASALVLVVLVVRDAIRTWRHECCWPCTSEYIDPRCTLHNA